MNTSLVSTKVRVPPLAHDLVPRDRLITRLEQEATAHKVVLVSAPAGYGKTTLLAQWARTTRYPIAWLTVDAEDNQIDRFFRYLLAAWENVDPDIRQTSLGIILDGLAPERDAILTSLVNVGSEISDHLIFVIDDAQAIQSPDLISALEFLIDHLPPRLHFVLGARSEPPVPLSRYRARRELGEIGVNDLRFTSDETRELLTVVEGHAPSLDIASSLAEQTEGWVAGLQLATLARLDSTEPNRPRPITGHHRHIADYIREDVLAQLSDHDRAFLVQTSIVDKMSGPLCDAITGSTGSQQMLESLERRRLFTVALDETREWFRYHRLFADVLAELLRTDTEFQEGECRRRAARWYIENGLSDPAFTHAIAAGDDELTLEIIDRSFLLKFFTGEVRTVQRWLEMIPERWYTTRPMLEIARAGMHFFTWHLDACAQSVDTAEQLVMASDQEMPDVRARITALRCFIACAQNDLSAAKSLAQRALEALPADDNGFRAGIYGALGDTFRRNALWHDARENYLRAITFTNHPAAYVQSVNAFGALADLALQQGRLREAATQWQRALDIIEDRSTRGAYPLPVVGWVYIRFGEIHYQWNDLDTAWDLVTRGRTHAELGGDPRSIIAGAILAARISLARGDKDDAEATLDQIRSIAADDESPDWSSEYQRVLVELWLAQDRLRTAANWSDQELEKGDDRLPPTELAIARVLISKGDYDSGERALARLEREIEAAAAAGRICVQIEALALQALAYWKRDDQVTALTSLEHAMRLAEPEGYVRVFADLGLPVARLLQEARHRKIMLPYVDQILAGFAQESLAASLPDTPLPEPLSTRETEVLQMIAAGLSNREIASSLFISPETVKKHTGSIYGKLGVGSRTEAVARSRELDMLD